MSATRAGRAWPIGAAWVVVLFVGCLAAPGGQGDGGAAADPCSLNNGGCAAEAVCVPQGTDRICTCKTGFVGNGYTCAPVDPCGAGNGGCDVNATCTNAPGGRTCACKQGYAGDGVTCSDVDECATANGGCDVNATCTNTVGARTCACNEGFSGDGVTCADVDECLAANGGCGGDATCTNTAGGRTCACKEGFAGDGGECADVDECLTANGGCDVNAACTNTPGSRTCACNAGYAADGGACVDVDECLTANGGCSVNATCTNAPGSRTCACRAFFSGDGGICFATLPDIDVKPAPTLAFGKVAYFAGVSPPSFTRRRLMVQNVGTLPNPADVANNLQVESTLTLSPGSGVTDTSEITAVLSGYDAATGLEAKAGFDTAFVDVTLTPTSTGLKSWTLKIKSNDPDEPEVSIDVTADVQSMPPCSYTVTPLALDFGLVSPPDTKELSVTIKNTGNDECLLNNLGVSSASSAVFSLPNGPVDAVTLAAGASLTVAVRAWPQSPALGTFTGALEFFMSSPTHPLGTVQLVATVATPCLTIAPGDLDFGTVKVGFSSSTRVFSVYNACSTAVAVNSVTMERAGGFPAGSPQCPGAWACSEFKFVQAAVPGSLAPGSPTPMIFTAKYSPLDTGTDNGVVAIHATQQGQPVTYRLTLQGTGDTEGLNVDIHTQPTTPKADVLLVIDDSGSMAGYQQSLAANFQSFMQYAVGAGVDYHVAVTTTDDDPVPCTGGCEQGRFVSGPSHPEKILSPSTANVEQKFAAKVIVGTNGSATETCLSPALKALTAPLINTDNSGFLRSDARLSVVCVTDAPDQSPKSAVYYYNAFLNIKGFNNRNAFTFNAIAGFDPACSNGCPSCPGGYDTSPDDGKYAYLVGQTNGFMGEICTSAWNVDLEKLGQRAFGFRTDYFLKANPDLSNGQVIDVRIDQVSIPDTDNLGSVVWSYDPISNSVKLSPAYAPGPGQTLSIIYTAIAYP